MNKKMQVKRTKALNRLKRRITKTNKRHEIPLKESRTFNHRVEIEMRKEMERSITKAFPNPRERASYISSLIKELTREIIVRGAQ